MWKPEHRAAADRRGLRYESDLTDAEWALVGSLIPPAKRGGRPRTVNVREVLNDLLRALDGLSVEGVPNCRRRRWDTGPVDWDGTLGRIHHALYGRSEAGGPKATRRRHH